jgi:hypothetical protein
MKFLSSIILLIILSLNSIESTSNLFANSDSMLKLNPVLQFKQFRTRFVRTTVETTKRVVTTSDPMIPVDTPVTKSVQEMEQLLQQQKELEKINAAMEMTFGEICKLEFEFKKNWNKNVLFIPHPDDGTKYIRCLKDSDPTVKVCPNGYTFLQNTCQRNIMKRMKRSLVS